MTRRAVFSQLGRWRWFLLVLVIAVGLAFGTGLQGNSDAAQGPYDPNSADPDGVLALKLLAEELGTDVSVGPGPAPDNGVQLALSTNLSTQETQRVRDWVNSGGTLVTTASSELAADLEVGSTIGRARQVAPQCQAPVVSNVNRVSVPSSIFDSALVPNNGDVGCFALYPGEYLMVVHRLGLGTVYVLATPDVFTNQNLGNEDNAVLAANLLNLGDGRHLVFSEPDERGTGEKTLGDFVPGSAIAALGQLVIAGLLLILWRWRRLGRPVHESMPVETPASALVVAAGAMAERSERNAYSARLMKQDLRKTLIERLGLARDASNETIVSVAELRLGTDATELAALLREDPNVTAKSLVQLAQRIESIHQEVTHGR